MKNYFKDIENCSNNKLYVKIFHGTPESVEKELQKFLDITYIKIKDVLQTETIRTGNGKSWVTITLLYFKDRIQSLNNEKYNMLMGL